MPNDRWTDDRLDEAIDASARRMTEGAPPRGLRARVGTELERRRAPFAFGWRLATAAVLVAGAVFAIVLSRGFVGEIHVMRPEAPAQRAAAPVTEPESRPATPPQATAGASNTASPLAEMARRPRRSVPRTIVIEQRTEDIPALDRPGALAVDTTPVAHLRVAPLNVQELSVAPLEIEPDSKPR